MSQTENLTIMFTDMVGFTERTARQSREQNKRMLQQHDRLLLPVIAGYGGRRIKSIGDAFLITFRSPTDAVQCGMALHDAVAEFNAAHTPDDSIRIRVAINVGEVRLEGRDIFGEPVNVAARVEGITPADEIYFTEAVYLAMNKAEVPSEAIGSQKLKGIPEPVKLFRVPARQVSRLVPDGESMETVPGELPFGGMHRRMQPQRTQWSILTQKLWLTGQRVVTDLSKIQRRRWAFVLLLLFVLTALAGWLGLRAYHRAQAEDQLAAAQALLQTGHETFASGRRDEALQHYITALRLDDRLQNDPQTIRNLVAGLNAADAVTVPLIRQYPNENVVNELARRATQPGTAGRKRAIGLLEELHYPDRIDRTLVAIADLKDARNCEAKLAVIKRLRKLGDKRALPAIKASQGEGISGWWKNRCLLDEADAAIKELQRQPSANSRKNKS